MRVIPYYCAHCGVRISPEDARFGRDLRDDRTYYCPGCVVDLSIPVADSSGVLLAAESNGALRRATPRGAAHDLPASGRRRSRPSSREPASPLAEAPSDPQRGSPWLVLGAALGLIAALGGAVAVGAFGPGAGGGAAREAASPAGAGARAAGTPPAGASTASGLDPAEPLFGEPASSAAIARGDASAGPATAEAAPPRPAATEPAPPASERGDLAVEEAAADAPEVDLLPPPAWAGTKPGGEPAPADEAPAAGPAPGPAPAAPTPAAGGDAPALVLNLRNGTVHKRGCRWERRLAPANRAEVATLDEARARKADAKPCKTCLP